MKAGSAKLKALLATGKFYMADLYTITLQSGLIIRWTNFDIPLTYAGNVYTPFTLDRKGTTESCGLSVDDLDVMVHLNADDKLNGQSILYMMHVGEFDNAVCTLDVAFMPLSNPTDLSAGVVRKFLGNVDFDELDGVGASMKVHHFTQKLNMTIPRNLYMPTCKNTMYDRMCGLDKEKFKQSGTVLAGSTQGSLITDLSAVQDIDICGSANVIISTGYPQDIFLQPRDISPNLVLCDNDWNSWIGIRNDGNYETAPLPQDKWNNILAIRLDFGSVKTVKEIDMYVTDNVAYTHNQEFWTVRDQDNNVLVSRAVITEKVMEGGSQMHRGSMGVCKITIPFHTPVNVSSLIFNANSYMIYLWAIEIWTPGVGVANSPTLDLGTITFTSGANAGLTRTIRSASGGVLNLAQKFPYPITVGDTFNAYAGCTKTKDMCTQVFYNSDRFRGYPFVPTSEVLL